MNHLLLHFLLFGAAIGVILAAEKPNIIFVLFDDMGYGEPSSYRAESLFLTPNLNRLGRDGMRFTDAHAPASCCTPSRYGSLTGRYPFRINQFGVLNTYSQPLIPPERMTVASFLKAQGYHTACIGKWHLGMTWGGGKVDGKWPELRIGSHMTGGPNAVGFDYFYGFTHARNIGTIIEQDKIVATVNAVENQPMMIARAVRYIHERTRAGGPFFLYFPMCPPHKPHATAPEFVGKSRVEGKGTNYADWIYQGDHMLGRLLEALKETNAEANTLVLVSADNGAAGKTYAPLRENKGSIYEGGHREPFVARWPGRIKAGSQCDEAIDLCDIFATCADLLDSKLPDNVAEDSVSILPLLLGKPEHAAPKTVISQAPRGELSIRKGPWKLINHDGKKIELFNLEQDLGEAADVASRHADLVATLSRTLKKHMKNGRSTPGVPQKNDVELSLEKARKKPKKKITGSEDQ